MGHLPPDMDSDGRVGAGAGVVEVAPDPSLPNDTIGVGCGLPDFGGSEVGSVGIRVSDALNDGQVAGIGEGTEAFQSRMPGEGIVDAEELGFRDGKTRASPPIMVVRIRYERVQTVIATRHLQDHKNGSVAAGGGLDR